MNSNLFFFICASLILVLSVVSICLAPIMNGFLGSGWGTNNCQLLSDDYDYSKKNIYTDKNDDDQKKILDGMKKKINVCKREKAMHGLEYGSLVCDVVVGGFCAILGLLHYLEVGISFQSKTGLIGIITGTIGFILTIVYVIFSSYIFNNDLFYDSDEKNIGKLYSNGASYKWNGYQYLPNYDTEKAIDDENLKYIKYCELGQKQYNYDSELYKFSKEIGSLFGSCQTSIMGGSSKSKKGDCEHIWPNSIYEGTNNKYLYDRWITTIILSVFIVLFNIGMILFGFFLFSENPTPSGSTPLPVSSVNAVN